MLLSHLGEGYGPSFCKFESPLTKDDLWQIWLKFDWNWLSCLKTKILKYFQYNLTILILSPLGERLDPSLEQTWIPSTQGCFVPSKVEICFIVFIFFKQYNITISLLSPLGEGHGRSFWTNMNFLHQKLLCAKFG